MSTFDFARATRDAMISRLPVKDRVMKLLQAVDELAQAAIGAGHPDAFADDGQVLVARLSIPQLRNSAGCSEDTIRRAIADARVSPYLDVSDEPGMASIFCLRWPAITQALQPPAAPPATCEGSHQKLQGVAGQVAGGSTSKTPIKPDPLQDPRQHLSMSDRERDYFFSEERFNHSFTHSGGSLPPLPVEVWDKECSEKRMYAILGEWWRREGLSDSGYESADVLGAILASRKNCDVDHQRYVEGCLRRGVKSGWRRRAEIMKRRCRQRDVVVTEAPPAKRSKPRRVIGPGVDG